MRPEKGLLARVSPWLLGVFVVVNLGLEAHHRRLDAQLSEAIQTASGRPDLDVRCRRWWDYLGNPRANEGFVEWGSTTATLSWKVCRGAADWADDPAGDDTRFGMMVLGHELAHLVGHRNESETECVAMWAAPKVAAALGGTAAEGRSTARWYATAVNAVGRGDYRAPGCLADGAPASPLLN